MIKSCEEFVEKQPELAKEKKKGIFETPPTYSMTKSLVGSTTNWLDNVPFWIKVIKISALVFILYWLFGIQIALLVGLIMVCLFLSKISLTIQDIHKDLKQL